MGIGEEVFPESLMIWNGFWRSGGYDNGQGAFAY